jgi:hypothetical protein
VSIGAVSIAVFMSQFGRVPIMAYALLSTNSKLEKIPAVSDRFIVQGLTLAPAAMSGKNVCPHKGYCEQDCVLAYAGRMNDPKVRAAQVRRTKWFFENRRSFLDALHADLDKLCREASAADAIPVVRFNVASDIVWERVAPSLFTDHPTLVAYDYTKFPTDKRATLPANYELVHSVSERMTFADASAAIAAGRNIVAVFDSTYKPAKPNGIGGYGMFGALPATVEVRGPRGQSITLETFDADIHDVRLTRLDGRGMLGALRGKGGAARVANMLANGFAHSFPAGRDESPAKTRAGHALIMLG